MSVTPSLDDGFPQAPRLLQGVGSGREESAALPPVGWAAPLLDVLLALLRSSRWTAALGVVTLAAVCAAYLLRQPYYAASAAAVILPREKPLLDARVTTDSISTTSDQASRGTSGHGLVPAQVELYGSLAKARATLVGVLRRVPTFGPESEETFLRLGRTLRTETSEEGLITISVDAPDPALAADLANAALLEIQTTVATVERNLAQGQLEHLERSLDSAQAQLASSERELEAFCAEHRVVDPEVQAEKHARLLNELRGARDRSEAAVRQRELHFTDADPELQRLRARLASQEQQLETLRSEVVGHSGEREYAALLVRYQGLVSGIEDLRDLRQVLTAQLRLQTLRVESPPAHLAVLRPATPPSTPAGPSKKRFLAVGFGLWLLGATALALAFAQWRSALRYAWVRQRRRRVYALIRRALGRAR